jgi:hypothetical protein
LSDPRFSVAVLLKCLATTRGALAGPIRVKFEGYTM